MCVRRRGGAAPARDVPSDVLVLQIERHVRLEHAAAESFLQFPSVEALRMPTLSPSSDESLMTSIPDLVQGLSVADAAARARAGPRRGAPRRRGRCSGSVIAAEAVYLIQHGRISLTLPMQLAGREQDVVAEEYEPGHTLGWSALIPPHRFTLTATAPVATTVLAFRRADLVEFCAANPHVGYALALNIAAVVGQRLQVFQAMWLREMQRAVNNAHA